MEEPELVLPQLVKELAGEVVAAEKAEAKASASAAGAQRKLDEAIGRANRLQQGAELALRQGRQDIAREAITEQVRLEEEIEKRRADLARTEAALRDARTVRVQLSEQLKKLEDRSEAIISRARAAGCGKRGRNRGRAGRDTTRSILEQVAGMEAAVDEEETTLAIASETVGAEDVSLDERLRSLERESLIEQRLEEIRARTKMGNEPEEEG